jgi:hypothetical protein
MPYAVRIMSPTRGNGSPHHSHFFSVGAASSPIHKVKRRRRRCLQRRGGLPGRREHVGAERGYLESERWRLLSGLPYCEHSARKTTCALPEVRESVIEVWLGLI